MAETYTSKYANGEAVDAALDKAESALQPGDVDDTPVNGVTDAPVSSNWAFDHAALTIAHGISAFGATLVDDTNAAAAQSTLGLGNSATKNVGTASGTVAAGDHAHASLYQPLDSDLTALASLSSTGLIERTGDGAAAIVTVTAAGKALLDDNDAAAQRTTLGLGNAATANLLGPNAYFAKSDPTKVAWTKTGNGTAKLNQLLHVEVNGLILIIAADTAITMPSLTAGTDYAIWCKTDGALEASSNHVTPPSANARRIGGFHYAPGGNASAQAGGDSTPAINPYSFWDLHWRFAGPDPRGMALVAGGFWADIYLLNTDPDLNGTSAHGVTIADGSSPPKIPAVFGGSGGTTYGSLTWFEAQEVMAAYGKRAPTQAEFMALAYGVTEATARGSDPVSTGLDAARTSRWGIMQATGNLWVWGRDLGGPYGAASWNANTEGRGSTYNGPNAALFGASWYDGEHSGSRASGWSNAPSDSRNDIGARGVGDHLQLV